MNHNNMLSCRLSPYAPVQIQHAMLPPEERRKGHARARRRVRHAPVDVLFFVLILGANERARYAVAQSVLTSAKLRGQVEASR